MMTRSAAPAVLVACLVFLSGAAFAALMPYRGIVGIEVLGLSDAAFGLIVGLNSVAGAAIAVAMGWVSDKVRDRTVLLVACAGFGAAGLALIWGLRSQTAFALAFCLLLPFGNALFSQSFSYARALVNRDNPARAGIAMSWLRTLFSLAWIAVPPLAGWVAVQTSSWGAFGLAAAAHLGCLVFAFALWSLPSARIGTAPANPGTAPDTKAGPTMPLAYRVGFFGVVFSGVAVQLNMTVLPLFVLRDMGGSLAQVGLTAAIAAAVEVPSMIAWGYLALRIGKETVLVAACGVFAVYFALAPAASSVAHVMLLQALAGVAIAALLSINISYLQDAIRGRIGLSTSLVDVSRVAAALVAAGLFAANGGGAYWPLMATGAVFCLLAVVCFLVARRLGRRATT